jgi:hypothetical protein
MAALEEVAISMCIGRPPSIRRLREDASALHFNHRIDMRREPRILIR